MLWAGGLSGKLRLKFPSNPMPVGYHTDMSSSPFANWPNLGYICRSMDRFRKFGLIPPFVLFLPKFVSVAAPSHSGGIEFNRRYPPSCPKLLFRAHGGFRRQQKRASAATIRRAIAPGAATRDVPATAASALVSSITAT